MTIHFKAVLHTDGTGGIQTTEHYFDFGKDMKALAQEANRLLDGGTPKISDAQEGARYTLRHHDVPGIQWYSRWPLGRMRRHRSDRQEIDLKKCRFPNEKAFLKAFFELNPRQPATQSPRKEDRPLWVIAIDEERNRQGLRAVDLIEPFGVKSGSAAGHYLLGRRTMSLEQFINVAAYLGMDPGPVIQKAYSHARKNVGKRKK